MRSEDEFAMYYSPRLRSPVPSSQSSINTIQLLQPLGASAFSPLPSLLLSSDSLAFTFLCPLSAATSSLRPHQLPTDNPDTLPPCALQPAACAIAILPLYCTKRPTPQRPMISHHQPFSHQSAILNKGSERRSKLYRITNQCSMFESTYICKSDLYFLILIL